MRKGVLDVASFVGDAVVRIAGGRLETLEVSSSTMSAAEIAHRGRRLIYLEHARDVLTRRIELDARARRRIVAPRSVVSGEIELILSDVFVVIIQAHCAKRRKHLVQRIVGVTFISWVGSTVEVLEGQHRHVALELGAQYAGSEKERACQGHVRTGTKTCSA